MGKGAIMNTTKQERAKITAFVRELKVTSTTINTIVRDLTVFAQETEKLEDVSGRVGIFTDTAVEKIIRELQMARNNMKKVQGTAPDIIAALQLAIQRAEKEMRSVA